MALSAEYQEYLRELFAPLGAIRIKRMFGGAGIYLDEVMFALLAQDTLYLKVDAENRAAFDAAGLEAFSYTARGKLVKLSYCRAPDEALDSPALMQPWARSALGAALRNARHQARPQK
ncbi:TfoX/Sxy family protein [Uliginosibacterium sediminicola]|uniref:TfoX/Sxy family protein n=1 Tax=Uliginosibacterium sediminicola TaxID=2024550 RepID=A0ABU9Z1U8_9RHOO